MKNNPSPRKSIAETFLHPTKNVCPNPTSPKNPTTPSKKNNNFPRVSNYTGWGRFGVEYIFIGGFIFLLGRFPKKKTERRLQKKRNRRFWLSRSTFWGRKNMYNIYTYLGDAFFGSFIHVFLVGNFLLLKSDDFFMPSAENSYFPRKSGRKNQSYRYYRQKLSIPFSPMA